MAHPMRHESVYEEINVEGEWWFPERPDCIFRGRLYGKESTEFYLEIRGEIEFDFGEGQNRYAVICGASDEGENYTLLRCFWVSMQPTTSHSEGKAKYFVHIVIAGHHFDSEEEIELYEVSCGVNGLEQWHGETAFFSDYDWQSHQVTINYKRPTPTKIIEMAEFQGYVEYEYKLPESRRNQCHSEISHSARIRMDFNYAPLRLSKSESADDLGCFEWLRNIVDFFSFATQNTTYAFNIRGRYLPEGASALETIRIFRIADIPVDGKAFSDHKMLIQWPHIQARPTSHFSKWLQLTVNSGMPIWLYLGSLRDQAFSDQKFIELAQSLEGIHRFLNPKASVVSSDHKHKVDDILLGCPELHREWLNQKLAYSHEPSLRRRLNEMCDEHRQQLEWYLGNWKSVRRMVSIVVENRNNYAHCLQEQMVGFSSELRQEAIQFMQFLFCLVILKEIGFCHDEIDSQIRKNWRFGREAKLNSRNT
ncbi:MAG: hypothetical protein KDA65_09930 [Planctomycetaceae bacterium]|nr:hypothetical protein [Planctomycetaceae bacterium]